MIRLIECVIRRVAVRVHSLPEVLNVSHGLVSLPFVNQRLRLRLGQLVGCLPLLPADVHPLLQLLDERHHHEEGVRVHSQVRLALSVCFIVRQQVNGEPLATLDLVPRAWNELCVHWHSSDDVESRELIVEDGLEEVGGRDEMGSVEAGLFEHFADGAMQGFLVLIDLALRKAPGTLRPEGLHEQDVIQVGTDQNGTVRGHTQFVLLPVLHNPIQVCDVRAQEGHMFEYVSCELLDATRHQVILGGAKKVQVEPVGQFHLEADPDEVRPFFDWHIYYEPAGEVVQELAI